MQLSDGEKLIMVMLSDIYEKLGIEGTFDPKFVKAAIYNGHSWSLDWQYGVLLATEVHPSVVKETTDIMDMWSMIETAVSRFHTDEKKRLDESGVYYLGWQGFDGNHEGEYASVAETLTEELGRYDSLKGRCRSAVHSLGRHRRMLTKFKALRPSLGDRRLSADDVIDLLRD